MLWIFFIWLQPITFDTKQALIIPPLSQPCIPGASYMDIWYAKPGEVDNRVAPQYTRSELWEDSLPLLNDYFNLTEKYMY